jgi:hypothetical protein
LNKFVVKEVLERKGMSKMTTYKVLMLDASGIGEKSFWMVDSDCNADLNCQNGKVTFKKNSA